MSSYQSPFRSAEETSYPFLKIARERGIPYAKVLGVADKIEAGILVDDDEIHLVRPVIDAIAIEMDRRSKEASR